MKTLNPFVPTVTLIDLPRRNRREQFKMVVYTIITIQVLLMLGWLLSNSARPTGSGGYPSQAAPAQLETTTMAATSSESGYAEPSASAPVAASPIESASIAAPSAIVPPVAQSSEVSYVVKSGDTLSRIARIHGTTVKAIKSANNLDTERLVVGRKLKMPEARA
jgi:LysM repeat protein